MSEKIVLKYKRESSWNDLLQKIVITLIVVFVFLTIMIRSAPVLVLLFISLFLGLMNAIRFDGKLIFYPAERSVSLLSGRQTIFEQQPIRRLVFNWQYIVMQVGKQSHTNYLQLQTIMELENGERFVLLHDLYPWQDYPDEWPAGIRDPGQPVLYVDPQIRALQQVWTEK
ncbi:hypothetical protein [Flavilitoribacter nigricans]|uniref:Uncharacterized protein n=1 Tax=Flavilitoribacter nigricans (strain ATCC 23147 / DSM 23189 / NBRC 102662 / NCIMB 1420 / SS-2) TaxID=1122177 RepID=A0A2D0NHI9_FLAN2|nr:hypothetical protein [Flavilitoribacter nigricans]PHN07878.1 hypothetical protein CRP01_03760 [Flavilitoribacter nigricans DSM 23189 = NBRC 102662]